VAVANQHLADVGYEALPLAGVAREAGTTRQALYLRWPIKAAPAAAALEVIRRRAGGFLCRPAG
jgi:AcrR family transcriptional regulator